MKLLEVAVFFSIAATAHLTAAFQPVSPLYRHSTRTRSFSPLFSAVDVGFVDIDESVQRDIGTMDEWATACGVQRAEGFQLAGDLSDVSVMTTQDLPAESPVLFVPNEMIFSSNQALQELGVLEEAEESLGTLNAADQVPYFYLVVKILMEYERGQESPWFPWLNSLPRYYSNGASMTEFCYECLPPLVSKLAMEERYRYMCFDSALKRVPYLSEYTRENSDLTKWAFQIAYTRSFPANDGTGDLRIVPVADLFNHGTETEIELAYDEDGNCYAQTTRDVPAGSPLRMSYGDPTNPSFLFARYGFVDESSPATFCKIMIPHTNEQLVDMGYDHSRMLFYKTTGDASQEVWDVLLYQILSGTNVAKRRDFYQAHMSGDSKTKQLFHEQYYSETAAQLRNHIDTFLDRLDELSAKTEGKDVNEHPRLPLILKHNEFVKRTFLAVRARYFGM
jgi:hypothetical protein